MKSWRPGICDVFLSEETNGDYLNGILIEYWEYAVMFYKTSYNLTLCIQTGTVWNMLMCNKNSNMVFLS